MKRMLTAVAVTSLLIAGTAYGEDNQPSAKDAGPGQAFNVAISVLRLEFNEEHEFGSKTDPEDLKSTIAESGIYGVRDLLEDEGDVKLLLRGEQPGEVGKSLRAFVGTETPFLTEYIQEDKNRRTSSQSTVSSGTKAELCLEPSAQGEWQVRYSVDFDTAIPTYDEGKRLIGRTRINWEGTGIVYREKPVLLGRFTRQENEGPVEYIFIYRFEEAGLE